MKTSTIATIIAIALTLVAAGCSSDDLTPIGTASTEEPSAVQSGSELSDDPAVEGDDPSAPESTTDIEDAPAAPAIGFANQDCPTLALVTYDSFVVTEGLFERFTDETCIGVEQVAAGDAGQLVSSAILTKDNPTADVLFGIDTTFLQRGLDAGLFEPYKSPLLAGVDPALILDPQNRVTPIDYGDVCVNYWIDRLPGDVPTTLDDLIDPVNQDQFVTQNPETSSPGFAFLLATIARYGDGWPEYWQALVDNGVSVTAGWSDAYYGEFAAGGGDRPIVTSYASSPPAEVIFADPPVDEPPTGVLYDSCFRQVEFAGILVGTEYPEASGQLIDFMLDVEFQQDIPLNMFVYPVNPDAELPAAFVEFGRLAEDPATLTPAEIEANREEWTERWVEIVLG